MNRLNSITTHIKLNHLVCTDLSLLYQAMTGNYYKKLPFAVMPMLPLGYTWLRDINTHLSTIRQTKQFRETTTLIHVHLQGKSHLLLG